MKSREELLKAKSKVIIMSDGYVESSSLMSIILCAKEPVDIFEFQKRLIGLSTALTSTKAIQYATKNRRTSRSKALTAMWNLETDGWPEEFEDYLDEFGLELFYNQDLSSHFLVTNYTAFLLSDYHSEEYYETSGWFEVQFVSEDKKCLRVDRSDFEDLEFSFKDENKEFVEDLESRFNLSKKEADIYNSMKTHLESVGFSKEDVVKFLKQPW